MHSPASATIHAREPVPGGGLAALDALTVDAESPGILFRDPEVRSAARAACGPPDSSAGNGGDIRDREPGETASGNPPIVAIRELLGDGARPDPSGSLVLVPAAH